MEPRIAPDGAMFGGLFGKTKLNGHHAPNRARLVGRTVRPVEHGKTSKWWNGRHEVECHRKCVNLQVKVRGSQPSEENDWLGDEAFLASKLAAEEKLKEVSAEAQGPAGAARLIEKIYELKTGIAVSKIPITDLAKKWDNVPRVSTKPGQPHSAKVGGDVQGVPRVVAGIPRDGLEAPADVQTSGASSGIPGSMPGSDATASTHSRMNLLTRDGSFVEKESMQVVILAGGLGTRLMSVAPDTPKAIVPVAGRAFVEHQFDLLRTCGQTRVLLCIGHFGEKIIAHVGDGSRFGMNVDYVQEDPKALLGTGGALVNALPEIESEFVVMYGDSYLPVDYRDFVAKSRAQNRRAVMSVFRNNGLWDSSNTRVEGDRVVFYSKKSKPGECDFIDYGLTYFRREAIEGYRSLPLPLDMARIQGDLVASGEMGAWEAPVRFYEIGKPEGLAELDALLRTGGSSEWKSAAGKLPVTGNSR